MVSRGVVYVAYGDPAREQVMLSAKSLREQHPDLEFRVICDQKFGRARGVPNIKCILHEDTDPGARQVKLNVDRLSPFDQTLYLDADTRVRGDITPPFDLLAEGWEMALVPCRHQGEHAHRHVNEKERETTFAEVDDMTALQAGAIWFRKCDAVHRLFAAWREEWRRFEEQDQAALIRALVRNPVRMALLGRAYNGGWKVRHFYSYARRDGGLSWGRPL